MASKDKLLGSALHGTAWRHVTDQGRIDEARDELRDIAQGRGDVLAQTAGIAAGTWYAKPSVDAKPLLIAGLLVSVSGLIDCDDLTRWTRVGYDRASAPFHGTTTFGTPTHQRGDHT